MRNLFSAEIFNNFVFHILFYLLNFPIKFDLILRSVTWTIQKLIRLKKLEWCVQE